MTTYTDILLQDTANNYFIPYGLIDRLGDVDISNPTTGQNLTYDATSGKWKNTSTSATVAWGGITGTLSDQTDLNTALGNKQDTLVSGTSIKTINSTSLLGSGNISVLQNTGAESKFSLGIKGSSNSIVNNATWVGYSSEATHWATAYGYQAKATGQYSTAIGWNAIATSKSAIQLGYGTNSTSSTLFVGFEYLDNGVESSNNWQLLNGTTGLIPYQRINSVIDNNSGYVKFWTGTQAEYDALVNNNTVDADTLYNITDNTSIPISILEALYPVGAIYIGTMSACPLQTLGVGTWQLVAQDRVLQGAGTRGTVGTTINESLPNITGIIGQSDCAAATYNIVRSGAFYTVNANSRTMMYDRMSVNNSYGDTGFDASRSSSTYQNNAPVQQDGYLVNIWERIS